jgi:hypothetical protein
MLFVVFRTILLVLPSLPLIDQDRDNVYNPDESLRVSRSLVFFDDIFIQYGSIVLLFALVIFGLLKPINKRLIFLLLGTFLLATLNMLSTFSSCVKSGAGITECVQRYLPDLDDESN